MRRWLPFQMMLALVIAFTLLSLQMVFAQTDPSAPPAGQTIQLQSGDTLVGLAARFGKPVACLQKANKLASTNFSLSGFKTLLIPDDCDKVLASVIDSTPTPETANSLTTPTFTPIAGNATVQPSPTLKATVVTSATIVPTLVADQIYTVVSGDQLAKIAQQFGLTLACVAASNNIANPDLIYIGQQLRITTNCNAGSGAGLVSNTTSTSVNSLDTQYCRYDRNPKRVATNNQYVVQVGDALDFIACDFGVELQCLKDSNPQLGGSSRLTPGETLTINFNCPIWQDSTLPQAIPTAAG